MPFKRTKLPVYESPSPRVGDSFFCSIDSIEKAYILGFILSDGHVGNREWDVANTELSAIKHIADVVGGRVSRMTRANINWKTVFRLRTCSVFHCESLRSMGFSHDKSYSGVWPKIDISLEPHLLRGYLDGDGSLGRSYGSPRLSAASASSKLMSGLSEVLGRITGRAPRVYSYQDKKSTAKTFSVIINGKEAVAVLKYSYSSGWGLKTQKAMELVGGLS